MAGVVADDRHIRVVYKDWPILTKASLDGAKFALAAKYQDKYEPAHAAMMALKGSSDTAAMRAAVLAAGVDTARLDADLATHGEGSPTSSSATTTRRPRSASKARRCS